tara:strand:+ start:565 stop:876 length:312 start_codon:yes stop_codon:yes gene_type:complete
MDIKNYSEDELRLIVTSYEQRKEYHKEYKKRKPSTSEQRKLYNKTHYETRKQRDDYRATQDKYYLACKEQKKARAKYQYYKRTDQLDKLKIKYPDTYKMFVTV